MNRKMTPILLAAALLLGLVTYLFESSAPSEQRSGPTEGSRVLEVDRADILQVRVRRDYWNSYTLQRQPDGSWQLTEPSIEPASVPAVNRLLNALETLPVVTTIDLPASDSERHREYGLWEPAMEVTVTTGNGDHTLLFGSPTADGKGVYCAEAGRDRVYVTTAEAVRVISTEFAAYRQGSKATG